MIAQEMTRDQVREMFSASGLTYSAITASSMQRLRALINASMTRSGVMGGSFRCRQRATIRDGYAELRCKAHYFENREAVTFNTDGFIGFAGWASDGNVQPVLQGFAAWVKEMAP